MRTTLDLPEDLLAQAMAASGAKTKREAVRWALEEALRRKAIDELLDESRVIDFAVTPDQLEDREIRTQHAGKRRRTR